jgi:hypothetical protein
MELYKVLLISLQKAGEVLRTVLRVCELRSDPYSTVTNAVTLTEV